MITWQRDWNRPFVFHENLLIHIPLKFSLDSSTVIPSSQESWSIYFLKAVRPDLLRTCDNTCIRKRTPHSRRSMIFWSTLQLTKKNFRVRSVARSSVVVFCTSLDRLFRYDSQKRYPLMTQRMMSNLIEAVVIVTCHFDIHRYSRSQHKVILRWCQISSLTFWRLQLRMERLQMEYEDRARYEWELRTIRVMINLYLSVQVLVTEQTWRRRRSDTLSVSLLTRDLWTTNDDIKLRRIMCHRMKRR